MLTSTHSSPEQVARRLVARAANRGEAFLSVVRAVFCTLVLLRMLSLEALAPAPGPNLRLRYEAPLLGFAVLLSAWSWRRASRERVGTWGLTLSAASDVVICSAALATNVLWPPTGYLGLLRMPDPAAFLPVVFVTVLRLSPAASVVSGLLASLGLGSLYLLDRQLNPRAFSYGINELTALLLFILAAAAVGAASAVAARRLVAASGRESARAERARSGLVGLLREHHDVRSLLSSAQLQVSLLARGPGGDPERTAPLARSLAELTSFVESVKSRALGEMAALDGATPVELGALLRATAEVVGRRFPQVGLQLPTPEAGLRASLLGGERTLVQAITNLLVNACEGDGQRGASMVTVTLAREATGVVLVIADDGPGFPAQLLGGASPLGVTSKPHGSGLGLAIARGLIEASGGSLELSNRAGGAQVKVGLPAA
ncbi:MAG: HAMP domain-containing histidine kinase [Myxococcota bacterium]|nr:HAMP domain-containing histidine kinase [Myxococcota bacterium]